MFRPLKSAWPTLAKSITRRTQPKPCMLYNQLCRNYHKTLIPLQQFHDLVIDSTTEVPQSELGATPDDKKQFWDTYVDRIQRQDPSLKASDFLDIARVVSLNKHLEQSEIITRLQTILRDIHQRQQDDPAMLPIFVRVCNMLMKAFIGSGDLKSAKLVLEGLINTCHDISEVTITTVLDGIAKHGNRLDVYQLIQSLKDRGLMIDSETVYTRILMALRSVRDARGCKYFFTVMQEKGLDKHELCYKIMMDANREQPDVMLKLFNTMKSKGINPSTGCYTILLSELIKSRSKQKLAKQLFEEVKNSGQQMHVSLYLLMGYDPIDAMVEMKKADMEFSIRDYNSCLAHYVRRNQFPKALEVFKMMNKNKINTDHYSYSILIDALAKDIDTPPHVVFDLYQGMLNQGLEPDVVLYTSLMSACGRAQDLDKAMDLLEEMGKFDVLPNLYTFNSILNVMARLENTTQLNLHRASLVWSKMTSMNIHPDTRTFNVYLSILSKLIKPKSTSYQRNEDHMQLSLWESPHDEEHEKVSPEVKEMLRMYRYMKRNNFQKMQPDFLTYTIVINALASAGHLRSAMQVYDDAKLSHVVLPVSAYNEIMSALQDGGKVSESMNVWHDMRLQQVLPDSRSYEIVLEGCEQLGLTETIKTIRDQRKADYNRLLDLEKQKEKRLSNKK